MRTRDVFGVHATQTRAWGRAPGMSLGRSVSSVCAPACTAVQLTGRVLLTACGIGGACSFILYKYSNINELWTRRARLPLRIRDRAWIGRIGDFELRCSSFEPSCAVATPFCNSLQICVAVCCPVSTPPATHMSHVSPYQRRTRKWCAGCTYWEQGATL